MIDNVRDGRERGNDEAYSRLDNANYVDPTTAAGFRALRDRSALSEDHGNVTPRERLIAARSRLQTIVFTCTAMLLCVWLVLGSLIGFGVIPIPIFNSFYEGPQVAVAGSIPCPSQGAKSLKPSDISVRVLNGTGRSGLAANAAEGLKAAGVKVSKIGNAVGEEYEGNVKIVTGAKGVNAAYTIAHFFNESDIIMDGRSGTDVDVVLGLNFEKVFSLEEIKARLALPLEGREKCRPIE